MKPPTTAVEVFEAEEFIETDHDLQSEAAELARRVAATFTDPEPEPLDPELSALSYRERLALLLERDEAAAHEKAWDTRGRGRGTSYYRLLDRVHQPGGGFTHKVLTGHEPVRGYAVSPYRGREQTLPADTITVEGLANYVAKNRDALRQAGAYLGAWHNPDDRQIYLDVSRVVKTKAEADVLARTHHQLAYYDLKEGSSINVEGSTHDTEEARALSVALGSDRRAIGRLRDVDVRPETHAGGTREGPGHPDQVSLERDETGWQAGREGLYTAFSFENRRACAAFIERLAQHANAVNHHPDVSVRGTEVSVTYVTHSAGDTITEKDRAGAQAADRIAEETRALSLDDGLTYRQRLAFLLERDEAAAHQKACETDQVSLRDEDAAHEKAWDTRGRGEAPRESATSTLRPAKESDGPRLKALRVPPKWTDVHVSEDADAALQATGVDAKGRTQYLYSAEHSERAAAEKFERVKEFTAALPHIRESIVADLGRDASPADREAASVLYLIDKTGFRVGSETETQADVKAFGASTLRSQHVEVNGNKVRFAFTGKKNTPVVKTVTDKRLAGMIAKRAASGGALFQTSDGAVRSYLKEKFGDFKVKDFRTYHGTAQALKAIKSMPAPKTRAELKRSQAAVSKLVAQHLGNTPAVARQSYIDPIVWNQWSKIKN